MIFVKIKRKKTGLKELDIDLMRFVFWWKIISKD